MSALAGGVSAGVGASGVFDGIKSSFLQGAAQQATSNFLTQGIATATGIQDKFDWAGVAVAGVVGGVSAWASMRIEGAAKFNSVTGALKQAASHDNQAVSGAIGAFAGAAARSVITGTGFGDNLMAVLPDVIGSTIGNAVAGEMQAELAAGRARRAQAELERLINSDLTQYSAEERDDMQSRPVEVVDVDASEPHWEEQARNQQLAGASFLDMLNVENGSGSIPAVGYTGDFAQGSAGQLSLASAKAGGIESTMRGDGGELARELAILTPQERARFAASNFKTPQDQHGAIHEFLYAEGRMPGQVTPAELVSTIGASRADADRYARPLSDAMAAWGIVKWQQQAAFLAQVAVETGSLRSLSENLNYSAARIRQVWKGRFKTDASAAPYANNPEALANKVYGGRMGNDEPGDGYRYRGRGFLQVTGQDNYDARGFAHNPDALAHPIVGAFAAAAYWTQNGLNAMTSGVLNQRQFDNVTLKVNGGYGHREDRWKFYQKSLKAMGPGE